VAAALGWARAAKMDTHFWLDNLRRILEAVARRSFGNNTMKGVK
jgi:hypothetical protein